MDKFVYTPAGSNDATLAIAASRSGGIGIFNAELSNNIDTFLERLDFLSQNANRPFGIKIDTPDVRLLSAAKSYVPAGLQWLIADAEILSACTEPTSLLRNNGVRVLAELASLEWPGQEIPQCIDGIVLKGNESGGFVGEYSSFILLQKWLQLTQLPLYVRGGVTPHVAAACHALGAAGVVLDSQVLLLDESPFSRDLSSLLGNLSGNETIAAGDSEQGQYFRLLVRPGLKQAQDFCVNAECKGSQVLRELVQGEISWQRNNIGILPLGQDVCFARPWQKQYGHLASLFMAMDKAIDEGLLQAVEGQPFSRRAPLAQFLGTELPVVQGPMARVSDCSEFAVAVSQEGGMPMLALALQKGEALEKLLNETKKALKNTPWGVGVLGFAPQALLDQQLDCLQRSTPDFAIIAGGRPDQAVRFQQANIPSFLHVPSSNLIPLFLQQGARGFIFEGRECGGHVGPLTSFVLWSSMVDRLLMELDSGDEIRGNEVQVLFAGGIHDVLSSAFVQVLAAPLTQLGVKVGILMGSGYLFTKEIVACGAIQQTFQRAALDCNQTVNLESGPGHASRCAYTPFAIEFFSKNRELSDGDIPVDERREILDDLIMGRLRIASKGCARSGTNGELQQLDECQQQNDGMFMLGQLATLRREVIDIRTLHRAVTEEATDFLRSRLSEVSYQKPHAVPPVDIAIIGIETLLPGADTTQEFWHNNLQKLGSISVIPPHRWDWRLYYSEDRQAKDKAYSKWGGFLNDVAFDPTQFGMQPNSVKSVDPMQLMALQVASNVLADAGYTDKYFDRDKASVIIGASGGAGDVGLQYGLRAELPRFIGDDIPPEISERLPEWTEDTFAGILINVVAGRISNRLNFGGVNFATDAACASSLAAIYQGVAELESRRSDFVLAGGVDTVQGPFGFMCFSKTQALSPRGQCNTFDEQTDGIVISEGIGMVALKRLEDAERDGDRIYAVIKGIGGSSDGKARGLSAPRPEGQLRAMERAYVQAGFGPETVDLFEAHGTGTVAGDTAELESTTRLITQAGGKPHQAVVGSVKTLIGHTKATAGIVGMIKTALALHHCILPPHSGVTQPNRVLREVSSPLYLINEPRPWLKNNGSPRRGATSAFGFGGSNFHVVLEEYTREYRPWVRSARTHRWPAELLVFCADSKGELESRLRKVKQDNSGVDTATLRDIAFTLAGEWRHEKEVMTIVASDVTDLDNKIDHALSYLGSEKETSLPPHIYHSNTRLDGKLAVLFPGQGLQHIEMLRELTCHFPVCSDVLAQADDLLAEKFSRRFGDGISLSHFIYPRGAYDEHQQLEAAQALMRTDVAQPALGAVEAGIWNLMQGLGVKPDMVAGHSFGEYVALFAAGYIDFETLMSLSEIRGRSIVDAAAANGIELGTMAAVMAGRDDVEKILSGLDNVIVANCNSPRQCIISGAEIAVNDAVNLFSKAKIKTTKLPVAAAFHSPFVAPAKEELVEAINCSKWQSGTLPVYSNTTAEVHGNDVKSLKALMAEHLVKPVEFMAEIEAMYRDGARIFLELGPKAGLSRMVGEVLHDHPHETIALEGEGNGIKGMLCCIGKLLCHGVELDLNQLFEGRNCNSVQSSEGRTGEVISPHIWMLNGSSARRATEPVKQVGVSKGENRVVMNHVANDSTPPAQGKKNEVTLCQQPIPDKVRQEVPKMVKQRPGPTVEDSTVLDKYFETMHRFLETQENVMSLYLGGGGANRGEARVKRRAGKRSRVTGVGGETYQTRINQGQEPVTASIESVSQSAVAPLAVETVAPLQNEQPQASAVDPASSVKAPVAQHGAEDKPEKASGKPQDMTNLLLSVVEDKTGYPKDMIGMEQNLEADLGIDSIKRVEIAGAILLTLPDEYSSSLSEEERTSLNTQATLQGMLDVLGSLNEAGEASPPFPKAGTERITSDQSYPFRHMVVAQEEPIENGAQAWLNQGHFLLTKDKIGVSEVIVEELTQRGCAVSVIEREVLQDPDELNKWCATFYLNGAPLAGIIHLAPLGSDGLALDSSMAEWQKQLQINEKSFFILLRHFSEKIGKDAHVAAASGLGGYFGRNIDCNTGLSLQGGSVGLLKSLSEECPELRVKVIDLDEDQPVPAIAESLVAEVELVGGRQEVGYPGGVRTIFPTVDATVDVTRYTPVTDAVILATGGLKGITAETLRELALPGNTLVVTGRSAMPGDESPDLKPLKTAEELQQYFIEKVRSGDLGMTPAEVKRQVSSILSSREMLSNVEYFTQMGATVEYHAVSITDEEGMARVFDETYKRHGRIDGVVHGAGVIEDKLLADKTDESWSRVVETKVIGTLLLQKYVRPEMLSFFVVFGSVAGRYGNSGQTDYATANELMSRLCCQLKAQWPETVNIRSFCWGPWGKTTFGVGMVTAETEAKFAEKGVALVTPDMGGAAFRYELTSGAASPVEIICGKGPWEQYEAARCSVDAQAYGKTDDLGPLLCNVNVETEPKGKQTVSFCLDGNHLYLQEHRIDGIPVLPAAVALEIMAETASSLWPGWIVTEVVDVRLLKGVELKGEKKELSVSVNPPTYGSSEGFEVTVLIQSQHGEILRPHYRAVLRLQQQLSQGFSLGPQSHSEKQLTVSKAYNELLFHGPKFQVIEKIEGLSANGATALVRNSHPRQWLHDIRECRNQWIFDPALIDAAAQMAILWSRIFRDETSLPAHIDSVVRHTDVLPEKMYMSFERIVVDDPHLLRANVYFLNEKQETVFAIVGLECISSSALNRLGGTAIPVSSAAV